VGTEGGVLFQKSGGTSANTDLIWRMLGNTQNVIKQEYMQAWDSLSNVTTYGQYRMGFSNATDGAETGFHDWFTIYNGAYDRRSYLGGGLVIGNPTGFDMGPGTINVAGGFYVNGQALPIKLAAPLTVWVSQTGGTNQASCVTPAGAGAGNPCQSLAYAWQQIKNTTDANGQTVTLRIANGQKMLQGLQMTGNIQGINAPDQLRIMGQMGDPTQSWIDIQGHGDYCVSGSEGTLFSVYFITCNGGSGAAACSDLFAIGANAVMSVGNVVFRGSYATPTCNNGNDFSAGTQGFLVIKGDLHFVQGDRQVMIYFGGGSSTYMNANNVKPYTTAANTAHTTAGSNVVTFDNPINASGSPAGCSSAAGCLFVGGEVRDNQGRIPLGARAKTITTSGVNAYKEITLYDIDGANVNALSTGTTTATLGSIMFRFYDDGLDAQHRAPSYTVSQYFLTQGGQVNVQGVGYSGRQPTDPPQFSLTAGYAHNVPYVVRGNSTLDVGVTGTAMLHALPTMIPGIVDGANGGVVLEDEGRSNLRLTSVNNWAGVNTDGGIECHSFQGPPQTIQELAEGQCRFKAWQTGGHYFYGTSGPTDIPYAAIKNTKTLAEPVIQMGIGIVAPVVVPTFPDTQGLHIYNNNANHGTGIRLFSDQGGANTSDFTMFSGFGAVQLTALSNVPMYLGTNNQNNIKLNANGDTEFVRAHLRTSGPTPTLGAACGPGATIVGSEIAGEVTMGTGAPTSCTINFSVGYASPPLCIVTWQVQLAGTQYALGGAGISIAQPPTSSNKLNYMCMARAGG